MIIQAVMHRKEADFITSQCQVEKTIRLSDREYDRFAKRPQADWDFIKENVKLMRRSTDGIWHCLLVVGETRPDGILVESEGSNYARYAAHVPNARELLMLENLPQDMRETLEKAPKIADWMIDMKDTNREWEFDLEDIEKEFDIDLACSIAPQDILCHVMSRRLEVFDVEIDGDCLTVTYNEQELGQSDMPAHEPEMEVIL